MLELTNLLVLMGVSTQLLLYGIPFIVGLVVHVVPVNQALRPYLLGSLALVASLLSQYAWQLDDSVALNIFLSITSASWAANMMQTALPPMKPNGNGAPAAPTSNTNTSVSVQKKP